MGISDKITEILDQKSQIDEKKAISQIELFMNWLFSNYDFRLNALNLKAEFKEKHEDEYRELDDQNFNTISILAEINGFSKSMVEKMQRIIYSSYVESINEIKDFFESIESLGNKAQLVNNEFYMPTVRKYFDCLEIVNKADKETLYNIFCRWVVAAVNSALGIKHNDVMLILSGNQGLYKTSFLNNLCPEELGKEKYLVSGHIESTLTNQNTANFLCEKFIINIDDQLEVIFGKEYNSMKAIISTDRVTSRRVYAKFDRTRKRIANFVGSVNSNEFLIDNQNRRYFIIEVENIKSEYIEVDMLRFWAEAYNIAKKMNPYEVYTRDIYMQINDLSKPYTHSTIEGILLTRLFSSEPNKNHSEELFMTNGEILYELQKLTSKPLSQSKLAHELKRQGYSRITKYIPEKKYSRYGYILYTSLDNSSSIFKEYVVEVEEKVF